MLGRTLHGGRKSLDGFLNRLHAMTRDRGWDEAFCIQLWFNMVEPIAYTTSLLEEDNNDNPTVDLTVRVKLCSTEDWDRLEKLLATLKRLMEVKLTGNRNWNEYFYITQLPIFWNEFVSLNPYEIHTSKLQDQEGIRQPSLIEIADGERYPTRDGTLENEAEQLSHRNCCLSSCLELLGFESSCSEENFPDLQQFALDIEGFGFNDAQHLLDEALCLTDSHPQFVRYLVGQFVQYSRDMNTQQVHSLLRLAIRAKLLPAIQEILISQTELQIPALLFGTAVWSDDITILHTIWEAYFLRGGSLETIEYMLIIPIFTDNLCNVFKFLDDRDLEINRLIANRFTYIEVAAALGRIEIAQVLLRKGASTNLEKASEIALSLKHFVLADMLADARKEIYIEKSLNLGGPTLSDRETCTASGSVVASSQDIFMGWSADSFDW
ncbi:hypothetical protein AA313_de0205228 [Arthrobotrys entomopaga]|nr:hypothetical protein AA313_de0205228 [Arthrobotrys entomopaga]